MSLQELASDNAQRTSAHMITTWTIILQLQQKQIFKILLLAHSTVW